MIKNLTNEDIGKMFWVVLDIYRESHLKECEFVAVSQEAREDNIFFHFRDGDCVWYIKQFDMMNSVFRTKKEAEKELYDRQHPFDPSDYEDNCVWYFPPKGSYTVGATIFKEKKMITQEDVERKQKEYDLAAKERRVAEEKYWEKQKELSNLMRDFEDQKEVLMTECLAPNIGDKCCARKFHQCGKLLKPICHCGKELKKCQYAGGLGWVNKQAWKCETA